MPPLETTALASLDLVQASPPRDRLLTSLEDTIRDAVATGQQAAFVLIDINGFAEINAAWGVLAGDAILRAAAERLGTAAVQHMERIGITSVTAECLDADHFTIVAADVANWGSFREAITELLRDMARSYQIDKKSISIGLRAAIVRIPEHASSVSSALGRGFRLLNNAARLRPDGVALSDRDVFQAAVGRGLENDLAAALKTDQIFIALQPKVAAQTEIIAGAEALVRWRHPSKGLLPPMTFIGTAEKSGLIFDLGLRVLRDACRAADNLDAERQGWSVAVNVSPSQLGHPDFLSRFLEVIDEEGAAPSTIAVEVTETAAMMGGETVTNALRSLQRCGLGVAIDDFGTGFSNLASLSTLHADTLKIDRTLVAHDEEDRKSAALLGLTVQLANTFGMKTVAEGVETAAQLNRARSVGCDYVQGYFTGKPVEIEDFKELYIGRS